MQTTRPNSPCPCNSGRKYKKCCGGVVETEPEPPKPTPDQGKESEAKPEPELRLTPAIAAMLGLALASGTPWDIALGGEHKRGRKRR